MRGELVMEDGQPGVPINLSTALRRSSVVSRDLSSRQGPPGFPGSGKPGRRSSLPVGGSGGLASFHSMDVSPSSSFRRSTHVPPRDCKTLPQDMISMLRKPQHEIADNNGMSHILLEEKVQFCAPPITEEEKCGTNGTKRVNNLHPEKGNVEPSAPSPEADGLALSRSQLSSSNGFNRHGRANIDRTDNISRRDQSYAFVSTPTKHFQPKGDGNINNPYTDDDILGAFRSFDLDKNNYVGAAEIRRVLVSIGELVTDEEIDEMIRMVDKDGDGQVSFGEFYKMVTNGKIAPSGLSRSQSLAITGSGGVGGRHSIINAPSPPTGPAVVRARNNKRQALDDYSRENNLRPESIKKAHKRYLEIDKNKAGVIDYTEFCEMLQAEPNAQSEALFTLYDYEGAGLIDAREILIALANFTGAGKDDKLKFAFLVFDDERNDYITKVELTRILKANHLAKIEAEVARKAETIMAQADKAGDGIISYQEFVQVSRKFPNILFPRTRGSVMEIR